MPCQLLTALHGSRAKLHAIAKRLQASKSAPIKSKAIRTVIKLDRAAQAAAQAAISKEVEQ